MTVASDEGANQTKLVNALGVDRTTLGDIVRRLVREGPLQRNGGPSQPAIPFRPIWEARSRR